MRVSTDTGGLLCGVRACRPTEVNWGLPTEARWRMDGNDGDMNGLCFSSDGLMLAVGAEGCVRYARA